MWATRAEAREHVADFASVPDGVLDRLLEVASEQCAAFAPVVDDPVPESYLLACIYQAKELYAAAARGAGDVIGVGDYVVRARPLTAAVKSLLRPESTRLVMG